MVISISCIPANIHSLLQNLGRVLPIMLSAWITICGIFTVTSGMAFCMNTNILAELINVIFVVVLCSSRTLWGYCSSFYIDNWRLELVFQIKKKIEIDWDFILLYLWYLCFLFFVFFFGGGVLYKVIESKVAKDNLIQNCSILFTQSKRNPLNSITSVLRLMMGYWLANSHFIIFVFNTLGKKTKGLNTCRCLSVCVSVWKTFSAHFDCLKIATSIHSLQLKS